MKRPQSKLFAGLDLHSNNVMIAIINQDGQRVANTKLPCELKLIVEFLKPYQAQLQSLAVESTFNWYWLVDGLQEKGFPVVLANPAKIKQYDGIKHANDLTDALHLAELQRLNILPVAHIYDRQLRPVRDLLRRRTQLVQIRTSLLLSLKNLHACTHGGALALIEAKGLTPTAAAKLYEQPAHQVIAAVQAEHIQALTQSVLKIEKVVLATARELPCYAKLLQVPGVGKILGLTITMETGAIKRFQNDGHFASYCRLVDAQHLSNQKVKAENNAKCGNKYLAWAFVEAANFARRYDEPCRRWYDRKAAKVGKVVATKALACKLAKAAWHVMAHQSDYDASRVFGALAKNTTMKTK